jgi:hypothetical protein
LAPATAGDDPWAGLSAWGNAYAALASAASGGEHDDNAWEPPFWCKSYQQSAFSRQQSAFRGQPLTFWLNAES